MDELRGGSAGRLLRYCAATRWKRVIASHMCISARVPYSSTRRLLKVTVLALMATLASERDMVARTVADQNTTAGEGEDSAAGEREESGSHIKNFALGTIQEPFRAQEGSAVFVVGERVHLRMNVWDAPLNTRVTVDWLNEHGRIVARQIKHKRFGQSLLQFNAPGDVYGKSGTYVVRVRSGGRELYERRLRVLPPP